MAEFPALPFFTDAYLADTRHLTTEEHGAYLLLLMCAWRTRGCALKDEDRLLARMAGLSPSRWRRVRPNLEDFFSVENGYWRQKKLSQVYETVAKKVEKNRANGAKGGRVRAQQVAGKAAVKSLNYKDGVGAGARFSPGWSAAQGDGRESGVAMVSPQATKTKCKTKLAAGKHEGTDEELPENTYSKLLQKVAAAASLSEEKIDRATIEYWRACNAAVDADILPTIKRICDREQTRTGQSPLHLAYYSAAILEARDKRLGAVSAGERYAEAHPPKQKRVRFDAAKVEHWRQFLGDAASRFRGAYLSSNWHIPTDHPVFEASGLGPDPCHRANKAIPNEIYQEYGATWGWRPRTEET